MDAKLEQKALLPCPFCGPVTTESYRPYLMHGINQVVCPNCRTQQTIEYNTREIAIERWNTRALQAQPAAKEKGRG